MNQVRLLAAMVLLSAIGLLAQSDNTSVNGSITDPSGGALPNAKVTLKSEGTGAVRETTTGAAGAYVIPSVSSGLYTLTVEVAGFKKYESKSNKVDAAAPATIDVVMQIGQLADTVTVEATATTIQTETASLGKLIEGKQVSDLQLNGRNPIFLALLKPGLPPEAATAFRLTEERLKDVKSASGG